MFTQRMTYEPLRSIDSATFTGMYQSLGIPTSHPASIIKLVNNSNVLVTISVDGVNDVDVCPANSFWLYDVTTNNPGSTSVFEPQGTQFYVKGAAGIGLVYLVVQYIQTN